MKRVLLATLVAGLSACQPGLAWSPDDGYVPLDAVAAELAIAGRGHVVGHEAHWRDLLADHLAKDQYACLPPVDQVFAPPPPGARTRRLYGELPHYGFFFGPLDYRIRPDGKRWRVELRIAVEPSLGGTLELPDCQLRDQLEGPVICEGTPYEDAPGLEACPGSGRFEAPATAHNLRVLAAHWSTAAEAFYNRDALRFDLPVIYDVDIVVDGLTPSPTPVDVRMPLDNSCGRTPYYQALRSGWSDSIVAHELGHFLGLLDEYEALSGITSAYPKTPFVGSEESRMGVSMKRDTVMLPHHHYLVLRRYHCREPDRQRYDDVLFAPP